MNFNYSYRAFLIASLLTGNLVLLLYSFNLSSENEKTLKEYDIEYASEEIIPEEELAALPPERSKVETNRAYNEAEKFISNLEDENQEITETTEGKMEEMNRAIEQANGTGTQGDIQKPKPEKEKKPAFSNSDAKKKSTAVVKGGNRNTTISYQLVNRSAMELPNPVYTCDGFGKVVININVNATGRVEKISYNKGASTTANQCLIDSALEYAAQARFSTDASKDQQMGTITFNFPGQ